jgi:signal transduction histidine kinase
LNILEEYWRRLLLTILLSTTTLFADELKAQPIISIAEARADLNGDYVPDLLGDTVTIAGRATVGTGILHTERLQIFIQDESAGINLFARQTAEPVKQGDSVIATGTIAQYNGLTELFNPKYIVVKTERPVPKPVDIKISRVHLEQYEGMLIRAEGNVVDKGSNKGGQYIILNADADIISIFISKFHYPDLNFDAYGPGDHVQITGILGQHDFIEPYKEYYEIYPRYPSDIKAIGFTRSWFRKALIVAGIFSLGGIIWIVTLIVNITNRKKVEEVLQESEKKYRVLSEQLEDANNMKDLLLDVITHDLKNPAGVLYGLSDMMLTENPDDEKVQLIKESSDNLIKVMKNVTTLARISLGGEIEKEELDLAEMIKEVIGGFNIPLKNHEISLEYNLNEPLPVKANPIIAEVFKNYISNAIKYASGGKRIVIEAFKDNEFITISVKDFGATIPKEDYERIFKRGIQLNEGNKGGRGIGLAIVKRIVEAHNGEVYVEANKPRGNIFYMKIPFGK